MLKQATVYKSKLKVMREQENDMRIQVRQRGGEEARRHVDDTSVDDSASRFFPHRLSPQLEMYSTKFDEFQGTVSKSNSVYIDFKQDMEKVRLGIFRFQNRSEREKDPREIYAEAKSDRPSDPTGGGYF